MVSKSKARKAQVPTKVFSVPVKRSIEDVSYDDIDDEELSLAIEILESLSASPDLLKQKKIKPLKAAIHNFLRATSSSTAGSLTTRISDALTDARWLDARVLLAEFRIRGEEVKLGTLQRWIREVDAAAASGLDEKVSAEVFRTLDAILRATARSEKSHLSATRTSEHTLKQGTRTNIDHSSNDGLAEGYAAGVVAFEDPVSFKSTSDIHLYRQVLDRSIFNDKSDQEYRKNVKIIEVTPAGERKPPNQYDATIYTTLSPLVSPASPDPIIRHEVPDVPGAFVIEDLLSASECKNIICQGEAVSFSPDCAIAGSAIQQTSILAHNFYYFADSQTLDQIYKRALPHLPQSIESCAVKGINARFRVYRYVPGAEYRPHIDGSWPRSGLDLSKPEGTQYMYDDKRDGAQLSRLTFLIYLNDDFTEGYTTFFIPDTRREGLKAIRVAPRMGSVLVFPHGESIGALLHEGSGVKSGAKYVIRTDVLYERSDVKK